mgnify:FL=1
MLRIIAIILTCISLFTAVGLYRLNELNKIPVSVENYSTYNLVEIYVLGVVMSALAYPIYPEVAIEHMSLYSRNKSSKESDFFLRSKVVQKAINNYSKPVLLVWDMKDYMIGNSEARVALALNGATLIKNGNSVTVEVPIKYPRYALVELLPFVRVQEGLFWVLQKKGWYHIGIFTWNYTI